MAFYYGNFSLILTWYQKTLAAFQELDLPSSMAYHSEYFEIWGFASYAVPTLLQVGMIGEASALMNVIGFTVDREGFERMEIVAEGLQGFIQGIIDGELLLMMVKFLAICASSPGSINEEGAVSAFLDGVSPQQVADMEREGTALARRFAVIDLTSFGALAFYRCGREDQAVELCKLAVDPKQKTERKTSLVSCFRLLGEIWAKRGALEDAESHFANALKEAKISRLPMLEVLTARDWKRHLLEPNGRDASAAEAVIDGACAKMGKTREQLGPVLVGPIMEA
jgi:hypothetical protein